MRVFGGSVGVAISVIVLIAKIQSRLEGVVTPDQLANFYRSPLSVTSFGPVQQLLAREAFVDAFKIDMYICIGVSVASLVVSLFAFQRHPPSVKTKLADLEAELLRGAAMTESNGTGASV